MDTSTAKVMSINKKAEIIQLFDTPSKKTYGTKNMPLTSNGKPKPQVAYPIKSIEDIQRISNYFLNTGSIDWVRYRNNMMFMVGINTGLRISDILSLRIEDVLDGDKVRDYIIIYEQKTKKYHKVFMNDVAKKSIMDYLGHSPTYDTNSFLFRSKKGEMLDTRSAHKILKSMSRDLSLPYNVGTHTLRKTFAYWTIKMHSNDGDILTSLQSMLNHSDQRVTFRYANIDQDTQDEIYRDLGNIFKSVEDDCY